jgi:hypothetical protein
MDIYQFMTQNGKDFWATSPDPGGWSSYTNVFSYHSYIGNPTPTCAPPSGLKIESEPMPTRLMKHINKLIIEFNKPNLDHEIKTIIQNELRRIYLNHRNELKMYHCLIEMI